MSNQQTFRDQTNIEYNNSRPKQKSFNKIEYDVKWEKSNKIKKRMRIKIPLTQKKKNSRERENH